MSSQERKARKESQRRRVITVTGDQMAMVHCCDGHSIGRWQLGELLKKTPVRCNQCYEDDPTEWCLWIDED
jgi:hypothetical protein